MKPRRRQLGILVASLVLAAAICPPLATAKKSGKKAGGTVDITTPTNALVPAQAAIGSPYGVLVSTVEVGRPFKGRRIRDVNITLQTTPVSGTVSSAALEAVLTAPNGATSRVFSGLSGSMNPGIGPLTLDDEAPLFLGSSIYTPGDPNRLQDPWVGSAQPTGMRLAVMDNGPATGRWTLTMLGKIDGQSSTLNFWRLQVKTGKPYRTR